MFNLQNKSILVVDDSAIMRMFIVLNLRRLLRVNITEAVNGLDALAKLTERDFDLLITDINMPEMNGIGLIRQVRTGLKSDIPILIVTTRGESKDRDLGLSLGANGYLTKPLDVKEMIKMVLKYLGGYRF